MRAWRFQGHLDAIHAAAEPVKKEFNKSGPAIASLDQVPFIEQSAVLSRESHPPGRPGGGAGSGTPSGPALRHILSGTNEEAASTNFGHRRFSWVRMVSERVTPGGRPGARVPGRHGGAGGGAHRGGRGRRAGGAPRGSPAGRHAPRGTLPPLEIKVEF